MSAAKSKGVQEVKRRLRRLGAPKGEIERALGAALYQEGLSIIRKAVKRTPKDTGRLRSSQYVELPNMKFLGPTVTLGFGTDYALAVHERVEVFHEHGGPKYLESSVNEAIGDYAARVGRRMFRNWGNKLFLVTPASGVNTKKTEGKPTSKSKWGKGSKRKRKGAGKKSTPSTGA